MDGFVAQAESGRKGCLDPTDPGVHELRQSRRDGLPHRRATSRTTGPTRSDFVLQDHMFEPDASWSLPAHLFLVSEWSACCTQHDNPASCVERDPRAAGTSWRARRTGRRISTARQATRRSTPGPTSPTCSTSTHVSVGLLRRQRHRARLRERRERSTCAPVAAERRTRRASGTRCRTSTPSRPTTSSATSKTSATSTPRRRHGHAARGVVGRAVGRGQRASAGAGQLRAELRDQPRQRGDAQPRLELDRDLPRVGRLGRLLRPRRAADRRRERLRPARARPSSSARTPSSGYIDHQTLSFDAYDKFIEDDFLGGQRLDPAHRRPTRPATRRPRGREDPRRPRRTTSTSRRRRAHPYVLPVHPKTTLTTTPASSSGPTPSTSATPTPGQRLGPIIDCMNINGVTVPAGATAKELRRLFAQLPAAQQRSVLAACSSLLPPALRQKLQTNG